MHKILSALSSTALLFVVAKTKVISFQSNPMIQISSQQRVWKLVRHENIQAVLNKKMKVMSGRKTFLEAGDIRLGKN